jgi:hypothetical protein
MICSACRTRSPDVDSSYAFQMPNCEEAVKQKLAESENQEGFYADSSEK